MHNQLVQIGSFTVYGYGLMIAVGVIAAFVLAQYRAKRLSLDADQMFHLGFCGILCGIVGAKLLYWITELPAILQEPSILWRLSEGFVVYGGIIAGIAGAWLYAWRKKLTFWHYLDAAAPSIPLAQGFGRIGCFLAGCCYGRETDSCIGVVFPEGSLAPAGISLIPTQLISSAGDFLIALVLLLLSARIYRKKVGGKQEQPAIGSLAGWYLILYSIGRFAIEFLRNDPRGSVGVLSTSQFIAIFMLAAGVLLCVRRRGRKRL